MNAKDLYDKVISENYAQDCFQLLNQSRAIAISQIQRNIVNLKPVNILDLALGTGEALLVLQKLFPQANFLGIDISQEMIAIAKNKLRLNTFHDDARNLEKYLEPNSIDIALMHFVLAYVAPEEIIPVAARVLRQGGLLSVASSTYDCFKKLQGLNKQLMPENNLGDNSLIPPQTPDELKKILNQNKLEILEVRDLKLTVNFPSFEEIYTWGIKSGWLTHFLYCLTDKEISMLSSGKVDFPISDEFRASIFLTRKI